MNPGPTPKAPWSDAWQRLLSDAAVLPYLRSSEGLAYTLRARGPGFLADGRHRLTRAIDAFLDACDPSWNFEEGVDGSDPAQALLLQWVRERRRRRSE